MSRRAKWIRVGLGAILVGLVLGRWLAVTTADRAWAQALGAGDTLAAIAELRLLLLLSAIGIASVWCVGNVYLVYRTIGAVHVPRRLGNLEILEAVPRRYLLLATVVLGVVVALALSHQADDWWYARALAGHGSSVGIRDPILGTDLSYYLFVLPWRRTVHSFVTLLSGIMLAVTAVLYAAVGAVRWERRRVEITDLARKHLGGLLAAFALALVWGYRLEPAEYVAGIHNVPLDAVLEGVRLPAARLLSWLALTVAAVSVAWIWYDQHAAVASAWVVLGVVSFAGHYVVPAFAGSVRTPEELTLADVEAAGPQLLQLAFSITPRETTLALPATPEPSALQRHARSLDAGPIWDAFAVAVLLNRTADRPHYSRFFDVGLGVYRSKTGAPHPVYLGVRQVDLQAAREAGADLSWERVHRRPYGYAHGAVAVLANRTSARGLPLFVGDLTQPDSATSQVLDLSLRRDDIVFAPHLDDFVVVSPSAGTFVGVAAGGWWRRLALAWALQSPQLVTAQGVQDTDLVLWHRGIAERLDQFAPFARFGNAYPVVANGTLYWLANGYVSAQAFAGSTRAEWRTRSVRYLRSSLVGVVEAASGATSVYLAPEPDPVSGAWAELAPEIVRPAQELPPELAPHLRYPAELFAVQLGVLRATRFEAAGAGVAGRFPREGLRPAAEPEAFWWLGPSPLDSVVRLRVRAAVETGEPPAMVGLAGGSMVEQTPRLELVRLTEPSEVEGPSQLVRRFAQLTGSESGSIQGTVRTIPFGDGIFMFQPVYRAPGSGFDTAPRLVEIAVGWGNQVARGPTLADAIQSVRALEGRAPEGVPQWAEARRWFRRLDSARQVADWGSFGRAYEELRRLLGGAVDTAP